jgi:hypothetical protein
MELMSTTILPGRQARRDAVGIEQGGRYVRGVGNHGDDDVRAFGHRLARCALDRSLRDQRLRGGLVVMNIELMAGRAQMRRHRSPHDAQTDETDFAHSRSSITGKA